LKNKIPSITGNLFTYQATKKQQHLGHQILMPIK
jgi:hypothetical protein